MRGDRKSMRFSAPDLHRTLDGDAKNLGTGDAIRQKQIMQEILDSEVAYHRMLSDVKEVRVESIRDRDLDLAAYEIFVCRFLSILS
jgi:hypothetical protein